ncbi:MAG TPA: hypothetical protein VFS43_42610 [Polyangiaceae bacterium]|nr:hypothetical protein [Polyangiaceae bacterium]
MSKYLTRILFPCSLAAVWLVGCQALTSIDRSEIDDELFRTPAGAGGKGGSGDTGGSDTGGSDTGGGGGGGEAGAAGEGGGAGEAGAGGAGGDAGQGGGAGEAGAGGGAGEAGAAGAGGSPPLTFAAVQSQLTTQGGCANAGCHTGAAPAGKFDLSLADLQGATNKPNCTDFPTYLGTLAGGGFDYTKSLLWAKLNPGTTLPAPVPPAANGVCGNHMPAGSPGNQALADLVRDWIQQGAQP